MGVHNNRSPGDAEVGMAFAGKWFGFERVELLEEGAALLDLGDYEEAAEIFEAVIAEATEESIAAMARRSLADVHGRQALALYCRGEYEAAEAAMSRSLTFDPSHPPRNLLAAKIARKAHGPGSNGPFLERSLNVDPSNWETLVFDAACRYEAGDSEAAIREAEDACLGAAGRDFGHMMAARRQHDAGDAKGAATELFAISDRLDEAHIYRELGDSFVRSRLFEQAIESYQKAMQCSPDSADLYHRLGIAQYESGQLDEAEESFERVIELRPSLTDAHVRLSLLLEDRRMHTAARSAFAKALSLNPQRAYNLRDALKLAH